MQQMSDAQHHKRDEEFERMDERDHYRAFADSLAADNERLKAALAKAEQALRALTDWAGMLPGDTFSSLFERLTERFYYETGIMAPGRDVPAAIIGGHSREERERVWDAWLVKQKEAITEQVQAALRAIAGKE